MFTSENGYHTRSLGSLSFEDGTMLLVTTSVASQLTGLSTEMLREWTIRRALIPADLPSKVKGSPAKFSWRTIWTLRIAVSLRQRFNLELQAHKASCWRLRGELETKSFDTLPGSQSGPYSRRRVEHCSAQTPHRQLAIVGY